VIKVKGTVTDRTHTHHLDGETLPVVECRNRGGAMVTNEERRERCGFTTDTRQDMKSWA